MGRGLRVFMGSSPLNTQNKEEGHESPNLFFFNSRPVCLTAWSGEVADVTDERFEHSFCFLGGGWCLGVWWWWKCSPVGFSFYLYKLLLYINNKPTRVCAFPPSPPLPSPL